MREWSLGPGDPLFFSLAADARLSTPVYTDDQIWELDLGWGEPPALTLRTTFGMRARSMRLFLRFTENGDTAQDPATFPVPPTLRRFHPNFLHVDFTPLANLPVTAEYWVPESQSVAGRITLRNESTTLRQVRLEVCAALSPLDGQSITAIQQQLVNVLAGQTGGVFPVVFMTGGPKHGPGPYPSLALDLDLGPGAIRQLTFAQAARDTLPASFELARHTAARPWEAERARIELLDASSTIDIQTGDLDWDAALAISQRAAFGLFFRENQNLPHPSFVTVRQPDHGFSRKGDGTDYSPAWSGQSVLDAWYLSGLLPRAPHLVRGLLLNFLNSQDENGETDGRPGLGGQRSKLLAAPMLATLAWRIHQSSPDTAFLEEVHPKLLKFFWSWFSAEHDHQRDGVPEWDHALQTGYEDNPLFDAWHPWAQSVDISTVHTPALAAMLYHEATCLQRIAAATGKVGRDALLIAQAETLKSAVEASWSPDNGLYTYRDRDTGLSLPGQVLMTGEPGEGAFRPKAAFEKPSRILVQIHFHDSTRRRLKIEIGEFVTKGEVEILEGPAIQWRNGGAAATSQKVYARLGRLRVRGLGRKDTVTIRTVDLTSEDHTLFLPIWAGIPEERRVQSMLIRSLLEAERFDRPFGLPALPSLPDPEAEAAGMSVHMIWNSLIGEGLLSSGFRAEAVRLTAHLMNGVILNLKQNHCFHQRYHAETGAGIGERNALGGFAPVGLFLRCLGVTILSAEAVRLEGKNLFPWPVTLRFRGLVVRRGLEETTVTFPNGEAVVVTDTDPTLVSL